MDTPLAAFIRQQMYQARIASLKAKPVDELKALWDRYPDDGSSMVEEYDLDEVHLVLNLLGNGDYCTV